MIVGLRNMLFECGSLDLSTMSFRGSFKHLKRGRQSSDAFEEADLSLVPRLIQLIMSLDQANCRESTPSDEHHEAKSKSLGAC